MLLISLIGEQPIPNLLPIKYLKPNKTIFVYTTRTEDVARRLRRVLSGDANLKTDIKTEPYSFKYVLQDLLKKIPEDEEILFNLTGGTKVMALAAYSLALHKNARFIYLQSEGHKSLLARYHFENGFPKSIAEKEELPALISINEYLNAHLPGYEAEGYSKDKKGKINEGGKFEKAIYTALSTRFDEILSGVRPKGVKNQIEIDLVIREKNQVGIAEIKLGGGDSGKRALDQLKMAGGREYLGSYTKQFLIVGKRSLSAQIEGLARKRDVKILYIPEYREGQNIHKEIANKLAKEIRKKLI
jgi:electron transfer flavoprotein alpha subunit